MLELSSFKNRFKSSSEIVADLRRKFYVACKQPVQLCGIWLRNFTVYLDKKLCPFLLCFYVLH